MIPLLIARTHQELGRRYTSIECTFLRLESPGPCATLPNFPTDLRQQLNLGSTETNQLILLRVDLLDLDTEFRHAKREPT